ncbi:phage tail protein [Flavobacterium sp.]|uniref:phage tail protein n=1 Tax=Flavobacterium sp. TaxID=239 RepID=UPI003D6B3413
MKKVTLFIILTFLLSVSEKGFSQNNYVGEIRMVGFNFAPTGWAKCEGQLLPIAQNTALFSILGTTYGGNGQTTFALPDLRGKVPMHRGQGPGLQSRDLGETGGSETNTLLVSEIPSHSHIINAVTADGNQNLPSGNLHANTKLLDKEYSDASGDTTMNSNMIQAVGGNQPVNNMQPYNSVTYIIALQGVFPPHN